MPNEVKVIERELESMRPMFEDLLLPIGGHERRMRQSILVACEKNPDLLACTLLSIKQGASSFAVLGLECDGWSGQAYLVPFNDKKLGKIAQPIVGYRGYATIGARTGVSITGDPVYEGDEFRFKKGTGAFVDHVPDRTAGTANRRITEAWALAEAADRPPIVEWMHIDDIIAIRDNSPGYRFGGPNNPWRTFFAPMVMKTPRRRLSRSLPMSLFHAAAAMDSAHEDRGRHAWLHPDKGLVIDGEVAQLGDPQPGDPEGPKVEALTQRGPFVIQGKAELRRYDTIEQWRAAMVQQLEHASRERAIEHYERNGVHIDQYSREHLHEVEAVAAVYRRIRAG